MQQHRYNIIRSKKQYYEYCDRLERLVTTTPEGKEDDIELLTSLIEKYDEEKMPSKDLDPIELIKVLMTEHNMKNIELAEILNVDKSTVSRILNYQRGLSKESVRKIANYFSISQEALNKPYKLKFKISHKLQNSSMKKKRKRLEAK